LHTIVNYKRIDETKPQRHIVRKRTNKEIGIEFIVSNPSFEIWFLLYFKYSTKQYLTSKDVESELKRIILNYEKNKDYFEVCKEKTQDAIRNSKRLAESWETVFGHQPNVILFRLI